MVDHFPVQYMYCSNVEALCRQVYLYLQRVAKERDRHYEVCCIYVFGFCVVLFD